MLSWCQTPTHAKHQTHLQSEVSLLHSKIAHKIDNVLYNKTDSIQSEKYRIHEIDEEHTVT